MEKISVITICALVLLTAGCSKSSVQISGNLKNSVKGEYLFLAELKENIIENIDSVRLDVSGEFTFTRKIKYPVFFLLQLSNENFYTLLAEPGEKIVFKAEFSKLGEPESVSGSKSMSKYLEYTKVMNNTREKIKNLSQVYFENVDSPEKDKVIQTIQSTTDSYLADLKTYTKRFIDENLGSMVTMMILYQQVFPRVNVLDPLEDIDYFVKVDSALYGRYPESGPVKVLHEHVAAFIESAGASGAVLLKPGNMAPEITLPTPEGKMISLSSTRGKVVLLDFWAAWCLPCRRENPYLVKAYETYQSKGFEIFQVSLDRTREAWLKGINEDNLGKWIHVSDLKYWNSSVVPLYKIESIPFNMLLDRDGKILYINLRGDSLNIRLAEIFN